MSFKIILQNYRKRHLRVYFHFIQSYHFRLFDSHYKWTVFILISPTEVASLVDVKIGGKLKKIIYQVSRDIIEHPLAAVLSTLLSGVLCVASRRVLSKTRLCFRWTELFIWLLADKAIPSFSKSTFLKVYNLNQWSGQFPLSLKSTLFKTKI